jgi:hypothetical protein
MIVGLKQSRPSRAKILRQASIASHLKLSVLMLAFVPITKKAQTRATRSSAELDLLRAIMRAVGL